MNKDITDISLLESGEYYRINGTKKILYWNGENFMKPQKDIRGSYGGWVLPLDKQPKFKYAEKVSHTLIGNI